MKKFSYSFKEKILLLKFISENTKNKIHPFLRFIIVFLKMDNIFNFLLFYSYLKWVDDTIDKEDTVKKEDDLFLTRQRKIFLNQENPTNQYEEIGFSIGNFCKMDIFVLECFESFFAVFEFDLRRKWKIISLDDLLLRHRKIGIASLDLVEYCFNTSSHRLTRDQKIIFADYYIGIDNFLDREKDKNEGYYNFPQELSYSFDQNFENEKIESFEILYCKSRNEIDKLDWSIFKYFLILMLKQKNKKLKKYLNERK